MATKTKDFIRRPYIAQFISLHTDVPVFALFAVHIKPYAVVSELEKLPDVYDYVSSIMNTRNVLILGDFNAAGRYLSKKASKKPTP